MPLRDVVTYRGYAIHIFDNGYCYKYWVGYSIRKEYYFLWYAKLMVLIHLV